MNYTDAKKQLMQGWNTWNIRNVLSHVLLPYGFCINLCLRNYADNSILREVYIGRTGQDEAQAHPGIRSCFGDYTEISLKYRGIEMLVQSAAADGEQYILVTPQSKSYRAPKLIIEGCVLWNKSGYVERKGDCIEGVFDSRTVTLYTDGDIEPEFNTGSMCPYIPVSLSRPIAISTGRKVSANEAAEIVKKAKEKLLAEDSRRYGEKSELYAAMRTGVAWNTIYEPEKDRVCTPVSRGWSVGGECGGYVLFCWDTYFASIMSSELDKNLACANAIEMTREKTEAGFVPNYAAASNYKSRDRSQPPVGALAVWEIYRKYNEKWLLEEVFDDLLGWNRWYCEHRMIANGALCWGSEPYIPVNGMGGERGSVNDLQGAKFESGLDNSPMYDDTEFDEETHLMKLADVGLTGLYIMDCDILAKIAKELGHDAEYKELTERSAKANKGLQTLWDDKTGIFQNKYTDSSDFYRRISPTNFYSLQSGEISEYQKQRVIDEHFYNENEFFGEWMMPSISKNDEAYPSQNYWRGLIWGPMNFLVYMALRRQGLEKPCHDLAERSANLFLKVWRKYGHICENYNAVAGDACGDRFYHWGGLLAYIAIIDGVNGDKL